MQTLHEKLYRAIVSLYPLSFREELGDEMVATFAARLRTDSAVRVWMRELSSLPGDVLSAHRSEPDHADSVVPMRHQVVAALTLITATLLLVGSRASELIAGSGLFHLSSLIVLLAGLVFSGVLFGTAAAARSHRARWSFAAMANAAAIATVLFTPLADRFSDSLSRQQTTRLTLPGVVAESLRTPAASDAAAFVDARLEASPRRHIETSAVDDIYVIRIVRSGGVDWLYAVTALIVLAASAHVAAQRLRIA